VQREVQMLGIVSTRPSRRHRDQSCEYGNAKGLTASAACLRITNADAPTASTAVVSIAATIFQRVPEAGVGLSMA
jgi:hypothetical protein